MLPYIPVEKPRVLGAPGGQLAAVQEPARITLITVPRCEPYGVIEASSDTQAGWLGNLLFLLKGTRARIVDPRKPALLAEAQLLEGLTLLATMEEHALLASDTTLVLVDATLRMRTLRTKTVPTVAGACRPHRAGRSRRRAGPGRSGPHRARPRTAARRWPGPGTTTS